MYSVAKNNYFKNPKETTIYTPPSVSDFVFDIVSCHINKRKPVLDPCVGAGSLLKPFKKAGYKTIGIDIKNQGFPKTINKNYLEIKKGELQTPNLVIMNPPFNLNQQTKSYIQKKYGRRPLMPELWLAKTVELFGKDIPIVLFSPFGLRLNVIMQSKRRKKFLDGTYPEINCIISLPVNVYDSIIFHSEILIFNMEKLKGHYFYDEHL